MSRTTISVAVIGIAALAAAAGGLAAATAAEPAADTTAPSRSLILNAFGDAQGTFGESQPFLDALTGKVDRSSESAYCQVVVEGDLYGQPVTVVVTGTGGGNSGPCAQEMLGWYAPGITEVIWSGIGGVTPAVGGWVDKAGMRLDNPAVMIGDVCIGAAAWSYDLHFSNVNDWAARNASSGSRYAPNGGWWDMLDARGNEKAPGFDNVQQFVVADTALADELLAASRKAVLPKRTASVGAKIARFHPKRADWRDPRFFSYRQCGGEVSGDNFWHGATEDRLAREYMAALMAASGLNRQARPDNVVVFSAMEAVPWMSAVSRWNAHNGTAIPMAVVRAASNYDQIPLRPDGTPVLNAKGKPLTAMQDILLGFDDDSSAYAASTAAAAVLAMFQERSTR